MAIYSDGWTPDQRLATLRSIVGDPRCSSARRSEAQAMIPGCIADGKTYARPLTRVGPVRSGSLRKFEDEKL